MARFVKFLFLALVCAVVGGCTTVEIPKYIKDVNPYQRIYYAGFEDTLNAATEAVQNLGWVITETAEPSMFEHNKAEDPDTKQILLFTEIRQTGLFFGSRYQRLNLILRSKVENQTEAELRYVTVSSVPFKTFTNYRKDAVAEKVLDLIEKQLSDK